MAWQLGKALAMPYLALQVNLFMPTFTRGLARTHSQVAFATPVMQVNMRDFALIYLNGWTPRVCMFVEFSKSSPCSGCQPAMRRQFVETTKSRKAYLPCRGELLREFGCSLGSFPDLLGPARLSLTGQEPVRGAGQSAANRMRMASYMLLAGD